VEEAPAEAAPAEETEAPKGKSKKAKKEEAARAKKAEAGKPRKNKANRIAEAQAQEEALDKVMEEDGEEGEEGEKKKKGKAGDMESRGLIYIGHLPSALFEPQLRAYFEQFGEVTNVRIARSTKTGRPKGYGWVQFEDPDVAVIVQEAMNGYLIYGKRLVVEVKPPDERWRRLFKVRKKVDSTFHVQQRHREAYNARPLVEVEGEQIPRQTDRQEARRAKSAKKLKSLLADYEVDFDPSEVLGEPLIAAPTSPRTDLAKSKGKAPAPAVAASSPKVRAAAEPAAEEPATEERKGKKKKKAAAEAQLAGGKKARKA